MNNITFTVFTPTYNRAHTLTCVYESVCQQSYRNFEWLTVDYGPSDRTNILVERWQNEAQIDIRYVYQENRGKHVAFNRGVELARGELFLTLDFDDACLPNALKRLLFHWRSIPDGSRKEFSGVTCLCVRRNGQIIGSKFPADIIDSDPVTLETRFGVKGEKWGFHRTKILRRFPFPEISGERFVLEGLVWNRITREYKIRFINEGLRVYEPRNDGLSSNSIRLRAQNPVAATLYYRERMGTPMLLLHKLKAAINCIRFSLHENINVMHSIRNYGTLSILIFSHPLGWSMNLLDKRKLRNCDR